NRSIREGATGPRSRYSDPPHPIPSFHAAMKHCLPLAVLALACSPALSQDRPVPAAQAAGKMTLPAGFKATLFAGEPDVVQPIAFTFDDRGRLWVVECLSYPKWSLDGTGYDRVVMFEDTDGDGKHDTR